MALSPKRRRFVEAYLVDPNATKAAEAAGFSPKTAKQQGSRLLTFVDVKEAIAVGQAKRAAKLEVKADDVLRELQTFAHLDPADVFDEHNALRPIKDMPPHVRKAIASVEVLEMESDGVVYGYTKKVKFWNKGQGLELLGKHVGLWRERAGDTTVNINNMLNVFLDYSRLSTDELRTLDALISKATPQLKP